MLHRYSSASSSQETIFTLPPPPGQRVWSSHASQARKRRDARRLPRLDGGGNLEDKRFVLLQQTIAQFPHTLFLRRPRCRLRRELAPSPKEEEMRVFLETVAKTSAAGRLVNIGDMAVCLFSNIVCRLV